MTASEQESPSPRRPVLDGLRRALIELTSPRTRSSNIPGRSFSTQHRYRGTGSKPYLPEFVNPRQSAVYAMGLRMCVSGAANNGTVVEANSIDETTHSAFWGAPQMNIDFGTQMYRASKALSDALDAHGRRSRESIK